MRAGVAVIAVVLVGVGAVNASAASAAVPGPAILSLTASPQTLPSSGGTVVLSARVKNATRCTLGGKTVACASGSASTSMTVAANSSQAPRTIRYVVSAIGKGASASRTVSVVEAAFISPVVIAANALPQGTTGTGYSANVVASGGTPPYSWSVVSGALPAGLSLSSSGAITGTPTGAAHAAFTVQVTDSSPSPQSTTAPLSIDVVPPPLAISRTSFPSGTPLLFYSTTLAATGGTPPYTWSISSGSLPAGLKLSSGSISGTPTTAGTTSFTLRVTDSAGASATSAVSISIAAPSIPTPSSTTSKNWSGYYVNGSGFTSVSSTFTVPNVGSSASTDTDTSEWVGIDGVTNANLIQAGVSEDYTAATHRIDIYAWWEILPAPSTPILTMSPSPGDRITVSIAQQTNGLWSVRVSDDTNGQVFTTSLSYSGQLTSAEWIVEAAQDSQSGSIYSLGQYSPNVVFTNLGYTGTVTSSRAVSMVQGGATVSTPSALSGNGFSVAYGSTAPSPP